MAGKPQIPRDPGDEIDIRNIRLLDSEWEWLKGLHPDGAGAAIRALKESPEVVQALILASISRKKSPR